MNAAPMTVAILGASENRSKFGNKAVRTYQHIGATVYPINPKATEIEGLPVFKSLADLPAGPIDRLLIYLPPQIGINVLEEIQALAPAEVWFNPGTESDALLEKAATLRINAITACSIIDVGLTPSQFPDE